MNEIPVELKDKVEKWRSFRRQHPDHIEIPGPGQESVWDYPRPPRVEVVASCIRVEFAGVVLAESGRAYRVLETAGPPVYYLPQNDIQMQYLQTSPHTSLCEWKGIGKYWSVQVGERRAVNAAWGYPLPWAGYEVIQDCLAFYAGLMDACYVGEQRALPQPGHYYGGWITPDIVGPFKGGPGTESW